MMKEAYLTNEPRWIVTYFMRSLGAPNSHTNFVHVYVCRIWQIIIAEVKLHVSLAIIYVGI